jgi:hypothetical protein
VLHLRPDEVVTRIGHGAVGRRIGAAEERATRHLAALHHLELDRVPDLRARGRVERRTVLPRGEIEWPLIHGTWRRDHPRVAVSASWSRQRELQRPRGCVVGVRIGLCRRLGLLLRLRVLRLRRETGDGGCRDKNRREEQLPHHLYSFT